MPPTPIRCRAALRHEHRGDHRQLRHRFILPGLDRSYPAGVYLITTESEALDTSFAASRRISTRIALTRGAVTEHFEVNPVDLANALAQDAATAAF